MSQEQLDKLYEDAKELMAYDDMSEALIFISYLSEKYKLIYREDWE